MSADREVMESAREYVASFYDDVPKVAEKVRQGIYAVVEVNNAIAALRAPEAGWRDDPLDELAKHRGWEVSWGADPDIEGDAVWMVHKRNGGRNDTEWCLIGKGDTPRDAIRAALEGKAHD